MELLLRSVAVSLLLALAGCQFLTAPAVGWFSRGETDTTESSGLEPEQNDSTGTTASGLSITLKMARLEASIVTRPANDVVSRRLVWEELDESGLMAPAARQRLNEDGFRLGVAGSTTPWAVQSLARDAMTVSRSDGEAGAPAQPLHFSGNAPLGPTFTLMPNGKSFLELQSDLDEARLPLDRIPQLTALRDRESLKCVFEVSVKELSDDWVILNVLPMIYSGSATPRLTVDQGTETLPVRQNVVRLFDQQFTVKMLSGEVAVIGRYQSAEPGDWTLGDLFFHPDGSTGGPERLLMIRMSGVEHVKGQSDPGFRLQ